MRVCHSRRLIGLAGHMNILWPIRDIQKLYTFKGFIANIEQEVFLCAIYAPMRAADSAATHNLHKIHSRIKLRPLNFTNTRTYTYNNNNNRIFYYL